MPRIGRIVVPGLPRHPPSRASCGVTSITQRGSSRMHTFFGDGDYGEYLSLLVQWCGWYGNRMSLQPSLTGRASLGRIRPSDESLGYSQRSLMGPPHIEAT